MSLMVNVLVNAIAYDGIALPISKGETTYITLHFYDENNNDVVLSPSDILTFSVKRFFTDDNFTIKKTVSTLTDVNGRYPFLLTASNTNVDTGRYQFDVTIKRESGAFLRPITGELYVKDSVTKIGDVT